MLLLQGDVPAEDLIFGADLAAVNARENPV
jgi:hypothetical protein